MNLKMGRNCILFIEPIAKFSAVFGLLPFYNFETHRLTNTKFFKLYSLLLACFLPVMSSSLLYLRYNYIYYGTSRNIIVLDFLLEILSLISLEITILGTSFWNNASCQALFQLLSKIEDKQNLDVKPSESASIFVNPNFLFLLGTIFLPLLYTYEFYCHLEEKFTSVAYVSILIYSYAEFVQINIISNIALSIKCKYEDIHSRLHNILYVNQDKAMGALRKVKILLLAADKIVTTFDKLFGVPIFFKLAHAVILTIYCLMLCSGSPLKMHHTEYHLTDQLVFVNVTYAIVGLLWAACIIFSCDVAVGEYKKMLVTCYSLEQGLPFFSMERAELYSLKYILTFSPPKFTAAGFFEIKGSTLLSILGTTATYFIVSIQFNSL